MAYITQDDYAEYVGGDVAFGHVPVDEFALYAARATDAIDAATRHKIPLFFGGLLYISEFVSAQVVKACCAQAEHYGLNGIDAASGGAVASYSIGKTQVTTTPGKPGALCPAARAALAPTGLLYAGVGVLD